MGKTYAVNWGKKSLRFNLPVFWKVFIQDTRRIGWRGHMGKKHVRTYSEMGDVKLIGISYPQYLKGKRTCSKIRYTAFCRPQKMFEKIELDTISIAAPTIPFIAP